MTAKRNKIKDLQTEVRLKDEEIKKLKRQVFFNQQHNKNQIQYYKNKFENISHVTGMIRSLYSEEITWWKIGGSPDESKIDRLLKYIESIEISVKTSKEKKKGIKLAGFEYE